MCDGEEVKRRQDLRQCIKDDYDKMLLRKERLNIDQRSQHKCNNSAGDDEYVNSVSHVGTQVPHAVDATCRTVQSPTTAFKVSYTLFMSKEF